MYNSRGKCVGTMTPRRLHHLQAVYNRHTEATRGGGGQHKPSPPFPEAVVDLLERHKPLLRKCGDTKTVANNRRATHPAVMEVLHTKVGVTTERYATPLTVTPGTPNCWGGDITDDIFGCHGGPRAARWTGTSMARPGPDPCEQLRAAKWAIMSASAIEPSLTVLLLDTAPKSVCTQPATAS